MTDTAVTVLRITAFGFVAGMLVSVGSVVPQCFLRYDISAVAGIVFGVAGSAGPAVLVLLGFKLIAVVAFAALLAGRPLGRPARAWPHRCSHFRQGWVFPFCYRT